MIDFNKWTKNESVFDDNLKYLTDLAVKEPGSVAAWSALADFMDEKDGNGTVVRDFILKDIHYDKLMESDISNEIKLAASKRLLEKHDVEGDKFLIDIIKNYKKNNDFNVCLNNLLSTNNKMPVIDYFRQLYSVKNELEVDYKTFGTIVKIGENPSWMDMYTDEIEETIQNFDHLGADYLPDFLESRYGKSMKRLSNLLGEIRVAFSNNDLVFCISRSSHYTLTWSIGIQGSSFMKSCPFVSIRNFWGGNLDWVG